MKNARTTWSIAGFASIAVGIFCLILPLLAPKSLPFVAGGMMLLLAIFLSIGVVRFQKKTLPFGWVINEIVTHAVLGIALIFSRYLSIDTYNILILWTILFSIQLLRYAFFLKDIYFSMWWACLFLAIFGIAIAVSFLFLTAHAETLFSYLLAFYFILAGMALISVAYNSTLDLIERVVKLVSRLITKFKKDHFEHKEEQ